jgi:hypothetical protein
MEAHHTKEEILMNEKAKGGLVAAGIVVALVAVAIGGALIVAKPPHSSESGTRSAITAYVRKHANDTDGLEFVKWGDPEKVHIEDGSEAVVIIASIRGKNALGAKVINDFLFLVQNGKVLMQVTADKSYEIKARTGEIKRTVQPPSKKA